MGEHQTRFRVLDDVVKSLGDSQTSLRRNVETVSSTVNTLSSTVEKQQAQFDHQDNMLKEVLQKLATMSPHSSSSSSHSHTSGGTSLGHHKPASVHMTRFSGSNPDRWVMQAERYFEFYNIPDAERVTIASFYFNDVASDWFDWMYCNRQLAGWPAFTESILARFRPRELEEPEGLLAKLHQSSSVSDYRSQFEAIMNRTVCLPTKFIISCFISGLRSDIKVSVLADRPNTLDDAMALAQLHEPRITFAKSHIRPTLGTSKPLLLTPKVPPIPLNPISSTRTATLPSGAKVPFKRLSPLEAPQRRSKGLCYYCDEKYTWDHKCQSKPQLLLLEEESKPKDSSDALPTMPIHEPDP